MSIQPNSNRVTPFLLKMGEGMYKAYCDCGEYCKNKQAFEGIPPDIKKAQEQFERCVQECQYFQARSPANG